MYVAVIKKYASERGLVNINNVGTQHAVSEKIRNKYYYI